MQLLMKVKANRLLSFIVVPLSIFVFFAAITNNSPSLADTLTGQVSNSSFTGRVIDSNGNGKGFISIEITAPSGRFTRVTDSNGNFSIPVDTQGIYNFIINDGINVISFDLNLSNGANISKDF
jgi:hypothetical protein